MPRKASRASLFAALSVAVALLLACAQDAFAGTVTGHARLVPSHSTVMTANAVSRSMPRDPSSNRQLSPASEAACSVSDTSAQCDVNVLADINAARAAEGVGPMVLPPGYFSLNIPLQLLVLANLERTGRGLIPAQGLSAALDATSQVAALADLDPNPSTFSGSALSANWAGGTASPLIADFMWMYDDGLGSGNIDCTYNNQTGCWGHRDDTLFPFTAPLVMGAAYSPVTLDGPSMAEVFVGGDTATAVGEVDAILNPTWAAISQTMQFALSATSLHLPQGSGSGQLQVTAPATGGSVSAQVTRGSSSWQVSPSSCQLAPGQSCTLTVNGQPGTSGTLTLSGPAGVQTVSLSSQSTATLRMTLGKRHGRTVTVTGRLTNAGGSGVSGQLVTLMRSTPGAVTTSVVARGRTGSHGTVTFHVAARAHTVYALSFGGSATLTAARSSSGLAHSTRQPWSRG